MISTTPLKVVSVLPLAGEDKRLVHLMAPSLPGKLLGAKELTLSITACRARVDDVFFFKTYC